MAQLLVIKGENSGRVFPLEDTYVLGTAASCEICLEDPSFPEKILRFQKRKNSYFVENLEEKFPVYLNEATFSKSQIGHGDLLHIGDLLFLFNDEEIGEEIEKNLDKKESATIQRRHPHYDSDERILESFQGNDRNTRRLQTLYKIHTCITKNLDLTPMMVGILDIIFQEFRPLHGFIMIYDLNRNRLTPLVQKGYSEERPLYSTTILKEVLSKKESILSLNAKEDERFRSGHSVVEQDLSCTLCAPMISNNRVLGVVQIDAKSSGVYSDQDLDQFSKIAALSAIAIDSVQTRQESKDFTKSLVLLSQGSQEFFSYLEPEKIRKKAVLLCADIFECSINAFFQADSHQEFRISEVIGIPEHVKDSFSLSFHHPFIQKIRQNGEILVLPVSDFPGLDEVFPNEMSLILIPLFSESPPFNGFLLLAQHQSSFTFQASDRELARILGNQILVACQNATLHQDILLKNEEIARWNQELEKRVEIRTKELQRTQKELAESEKMAALGRLATGISHEFNNMLTSMFGFAQMAKNSDEYKDRLVDMVFKQTRRGREITHGLLELNRDTPILREEIDFIPILKELATQQEKNLEEYNIQLVWELPPTLKFSCDISRLKLALFHLIRNGIDSMEKKGGTLTISGKLEGNKGFLAVKDTGVGIRQENIAKIFDPFYTTKGAFGGGTQEGIGFGLTYCQRIVKDHNGEIQIQSEVGQGTCFTIILPL